ncbi:hypothetical protein ACJX0J_015997, partial [Zea mays]
VFAIFALLEPLRFWAPYIIAATLDSRPHSPSMMLDKDMFFTRTSIIHIEQMLEHYLPLWSPTWTKKRRVTQVINKCDVILDLKYLVTSVPTGAITGKNPNKTSHCMLEILNELEEDVDQDRATEKDTALAKKSKTQRGFLSVLAALPWTLLKHL